MSTVKGAKARAIAVGLILIVLAVGFISLIQKGTIVNIGLTTTPTTTTGTATTTATTTTKTTPTKTTYWTTATTDGHTTTYLTTATTITTTNTYVAVIVDWVSMVFQQYWLWILLAIIILMAGYYLYTRKKRKTAIVG